MKYEDMNNRMLDFFSNVGTLDKVFHNWQMVSISDMKIFSAIAMA